MEEAAEVDYCSKFIGTCRKLARKVRPARAALEMQIHIPNPRGSAPRKVLEHATRRETGEYRLSRWLPANGKAALCSKCFERTGCVLVAAITNWCARKLGKPGNSETGVQAEQESTRLRNYHSYG